MRSTLDQVPLVRDFALGEHLVQLLVTRLEAVAIGSPCAQTQIEPGERFGVALHRDAQRIDGVPLLAFDRLAQHRIQAESAGESDSRGFLSGLAAFSRKASRFFSSDSSNTASSTATIGVRGLSEEQIRTAKPDLAEFEKMQGFASDSVRLGRFISDGQLNAVQVGYIKLKKETRQQKK